MHHGDAADTQTVIGNLVEAQVKLDHCFEDIKPDDPACGVIQQAVADKGYHSNEVLKSCTELGIRSYIPERQGGERTWTDKDEQTKASFHGNRQRMKRSKGKNLQKRRSELVERGFAHVCETGGARKSWLRGLENVRKRHLISVAAHNLGLVMRTLIGFSKPRAFSAGVGLAVLCHLALFVLAATPRRLRAYSLFLYRHFLELFPGPEVRLTGKTIVAFSTGCYGRHPFGQSLLLARRLVEAGVPIVQANMGPVQNWDSHQAIFSTLKGRLLSPLDQAVAALLDDLESSGRLADTMVIVLGEFGRTPKINKEGGRDHWGPCFTGLFAGAGVQGGKVIGRTDDIAAYPDSAAYSPDDIGATVYQALGLEPHSIVHDRIGRPVHLNEGKVIEALYNGVEST